MRAIKNVFWRVIAGKTKRLNIIWLTMRAHTSALIECSLVISKGLLGCLPLLMLLNSIIKNFLEHPFIAWFVLHQMESWFCETHFGSGKIIIQMPCLVRGFIQKSKFLTPHVAFCWNTCSMGTNQTHKHSIKKSKFKLDKRAQHCAFPSNSFVHFTMISLQNKKKENIYFNEHQNVLFGRTNANLILIWSWRVRFHCFHKPYFDIFH